MRRWVSGSLSQFSAENVSYTVTRIDSAPFFGCHEGHRFHGGVKPFNPRQMYSWPNATMISADVTASLTVALRMLCGYSDRSRTVC